MLCPHEQSKKQHPLSPEALQSEEPLHSADPPCCRLQHLRWRCHTAAASTSATTTLENPNPPPSPPLHPPADPLSSSNRKLPPRTLQIGFSLISIFQTQKTLWSFSLYQPSTFNFLLHLQFSASVADQFCASAMESLLEITAGKHQLKVDEVTASVSDSKGVGFFVSGSDEVSADTGQQPPPHAIYFMKTRIKRTIVAENDSTRNPSERICSSAVLPLGSCYLLPAQVTRKIMGSLENMCLFDSASHRLTNLPLTVLQSSATMQQPKLCFLIASWSEKTKELPLLPSPFAGKEMRSLPERKQKVGLAAKSLVHSPNRV